MRSEGGGEGSTVQVLVVLERDGRKGVVEGETQAAEQR